MKKATITEAKAAKEIDVASVDDSADSDRKLFSTLQAKLTQLEAERKAEAK